MEKKKLQTVVSEDLYKQVDFFTKKLGLSQGEFLRQSLIFYLNYLASVERNKKEVLEE